MSVAGMGRAAGSKIVLLDARLRPNQASPLCISPPPFRSGSALRGPCPRRGAPTAANPRHDPFTASYDLFDAQMRLMERLRDDIDAAERAVDAQLDSTLRRQQRNLSDLHSSPAQSQAPRQGGGGAWEAAAAPPGAQSWHRQYRSENGSSRVFFSESYTVYGGGAAPITPQTDAAGAPPLPALLAAAAVAGAWAAVAAALARRFHQTTYAEKWRWAMLAGWPLLALLSSEFREQMNGALRGRSKENNGTGDMRAGRVVIQQPSQGAPDSDN